MTDHGSSSVAHAKQPRIPVHIRWAIRRDMREIVNIENKSHLFPWGEEDFLNCLRQRNCIGMVAEGPDMDRVIGFIVYELHKRRLEIVNLAVDPSLRRRGVGMAMIDKLRGKLSQQRRTEIAAAVWERNLDAQLFFKAAGFFCDRTMAGHFATPDGGKEDAYLMSHRIGSSNPKPRWTNRIANLADE